MSYILILTTTPNETMAKEITKELFNSSLVACVSKTKTSSTFRWEGKVVEEEEIQLLIKTRFEHFEKIKDKILELHSYEVPEIISLPILGSTNEYLKFIDDATKGDR